MAVKLNTGIKIINKTYRRSIENPQIASQKFKIIVVGRVSG
jgi:predicted secreted protein